MNRAMSEDEFIAYYDEFADSLFRHCYFRVSDRERARDLVQETLTRAWAYLADGNRIEHIRAFLYRVADNLIVDEARKKRPLSLDQLRDEGFDPGEDRRAALTDRLDAAHLLRFLDALDFKHRELIVMRYVDGLGPKEIAEITGESENVVSVRLHRAVATLKELLQYHDHA